MKSKMKVLVTCGPTREPLDPVRFISNRSTGTLGIELARAFAARGHRVVLAAGPIGALPDLGARVRVVRFETAVELHRISLKEFSRCDAVCMTAAVGDFRPERVSASKLKRGKTAFSIRLVPNPDILADLGKRKKAHQMLIGFSLETESLEKFAKAKFAAKNLDILAAQTTGPRRTPFGAVKMDALLIDRDGGREMLRGTTKRHLAVRLVRMTEARIDRLKAI